ncbi:MAG: prepilin-type N-terminal cleavage/methylation domain-containing protein [Pseudohongiellaceae bacterium]
MSLADLKYARGFTLLELMLALSLTALLLTLLSAGVYGVVRDWDDNQEGLDTTLDQTVAMLQVERALQGAMAHSYRDMDTLGRFIFFRGEPDSLAWVSTVSPQRSGGLTAWRLESDPGEGVALQLAPALTDSPEARLEAAPERALLPGYTAEFRYLVQQGDGQRIWRDTWDGEQRMGLPLAVHVLLSPLEGSGRDRDAVLDIVAPVFANTHRSINPNPLADE